MALSGVKPGGRVSWTSMPWALAFPRLLTLRVYVRLLPSVMTGAVTVLLMVKSELVMVVVSVFLITVTSLPLESI